MRYVIPVIYIAAGIWCAVVASWGSWRFALFAIAFLGCGAFVGYYAWTGKPTPWVLQITAWLLALIAVGFVVLAHRALSQIH